MINYEYAKFNGSSTENAKRYNKKTRRNFFGILYVLCTLYFVNRKIAIIAVMQTRMEKGPILNVPRTIEANMKK